MDGKKKYKETLAALGFWEGKSHLTGGAYWLGQRN